MANTKSASCAISAVVTMEKKAKSATIRATEPFRLLDLPFELRERIYHFILPRSLPKASTMSEDPFADKTLTYPRLFSAWISSKSNLSLLRVSHQVSREAIDYYFANNTFDVWIPLVPEPFDETQAQIWLLPPVQNSWHGFPFQVSGRWYSRIDLKFWRQMRRVCVIVGASGWVRPGTPRYEWTVYGRDNTITAPDELGEDVMAAEPCDCTNTLKDDRADNFSLFCDILDVGRDRAKPLLQFQLVCLISSKACDNGADVANCEKIQAQICQRLGIERGGKSVMSNFRDAKGTPLGRNINTV